MTPKLNKEIADHILELREDLKKASKIEDKVRFAEKLRKTINELPKSTNSQ